MAQRFFPNRPDSHPKVYAYSDSHQDYEGLLKVGYTTVEVEKRVAQQYPTLRPGGKPYEIVLEESAIRNDGSSFTDHDVHRFLKQMGMKNPRGEWFECDIEDVKAAVVSVRLGRKNPENRTQEFSMRPEQREAVEKTAEYFKETISDSTTGTPHFLWNAKMRFGKTFAAYQLANKMGWKRLLVLTFKPAVESAWEEDIKQHVAFEEWQFVSRKSLQPEELDMKRPFVCFGSFQDYLGKNRNTGGIKVKNEWVHTTHWDCIILDEYHYGAWRENAKELFDAEEKDEANFVNGEGIKYFDEDILPITTEAYLYLSGTPFRALASGEFIEEQIYNWTYTDEQLAKSTWIGEDNPYRALPRMVMMTYQLPEELRAIAMQGEFNEFDLNTFFEAEGIDEEAKFVFQEEVQKWLDLIRGALKETTVDNLKLGSKKPPLPYSDVRLKNAVTHSLWFLPSVASCHAMKNLLGLRQNHFFDEYSVVVAAGSRAGIGVDALGPVLDAMEDPLKTKSITLSCGKLTTGVTVKPWSGIFMLRNCSTPETYFQAAFRVQSPWEIDITPTQKQSLKDECYVFDFAPERALRQIADYSCRLSVEDSNPEQKVQEFIRFLPVLAYDGSSMKQIDAAGVLDMAMSGTSATLLARRWESALLVNVDNSTLEKLLRNGDAMKALMSIEGFRNLNQDIETIINKSEAVKKVKKEKNDEQFTKEEKKQLTEEEKEYKSKRKEIQEKLMKFATRIPVFMYLTDYRERSLKDVITKLEPSLFKSVTGINMADFELLLSLGVFNSSLMNDAIYKFKRYEDASLEYVGINRHSGKDVGLFDTVITVQDYTEFENVEYS